MIAALDWWTGKMTSPKEVIIFHLESGSFLSAGATEASINARDHVGYPCTPVFLLEISKKQSKNAASPVIVV